jgi:hypothetical protein
MTADLIKSLPARREHFLLESGYHTDFGLDHSLTVPASFESVFDFGHWTLDFF